MSEIPELPAHAPRSRPVPAGGLEAALAGGRRRRNRFLGVTGGATTAAVVTVVLLASLGTSAERDDSLRYADPEATASSSAEPAQSAAPQPASAPSPDASGTASPEPTPGPGEESPAAAEEPAPEPDGTLAYEGRLAYTEDPQETSAPAICQGAPNTTQPLITSASGCATGGPSTSTARQGGQVTGTFGFCVSHNEDPVVLGYDDGREHEVRVHAGDADGPVVWIFSDTVYYPQGAHERTVPGGRCLEWTGVWDTTLADGGAAPAGEYWVAMTAVPDRADGRSMGEHDGGGMAFSVTLTEG